ncbi:MAG: type I methionyl aminopeptidase [Hornefia sp.]|nr:type I methionyl aminopeptidase [Hornefia sp.]
MIVIKSSQEIELMRKAGKVNAEIFEGLRTFVKPGITTLDIDKYVEEVIKKRGMIAAEKGYCGFPASVCTSVNDEVVHGIPSKDRVLLDGDIVSVDLVVQYQGYMADSCRTFGVGSISGQAQKLIDTAEKSFFEGIKYAKEGYRLFDISHRIQQVVEGEGFGVIRDYTGHGIGTEMHEDPAIPNYGKAGKGPRLQKGMTLAIEPMIVEHSYETETLLNNWTVVTEDGGLAAHYENTLAITDGEPDILTI